MESDRLAGMAGCKFKVGGLAPESDAERVRAARAAAGPGFVLAVDANRGWAGEGGVRFARLVGRREIAWFMEPCHWHAASRVMPPLSARPPRPIPARHAQRTRHA